ncbi:probable G-protein coupled receptor CG31760 [Actinia tenebrosa]|uniref:Probable G-protein coupled receptor CG31760 n=1 Tax=Actinia tenebrosa TaxID=6105 RepID=A0A6P8H6L9_ACTTE|nr:probable G-protein coupled receptor CG31760 [Actinia tenebrosa]
MIINLVIFALLQAVSSVEANRMDGPAAMGSNSSIKPTLSNISPRSKRVRKNLQENNFKSLIEALQRVQRIQKQMDEYSECKANDSIVLGIKFDISGWEHEASLVLEVANLLTSLWRNTKSIVQSDTFLYTVVRSNVLFSKSVYGSVICFERNHYKDYERFCPYAYRDKKLNGHIHIMDISVGHDYLTDNDTIWWREPRVKAKNMQVKKLFMTEYQTTRFNATAANSMVNLTLPVLQHMEQGFWTRPYFDCFGGKSWMVTYLAPFFNETNNFLGVVSIDVALNDVDIDQCDRDDTDTAKGFANNTVHFNEHVKLKDFLGTHRCKASTKCVKIPNQGFKRGSYWCACRKGYYFPPSSGPEKRFNGSIIETEFDKKLKGLQNDYDDNFECIKCSEGCTECTDDKPCRYSILHGPRFLLVIIDGVAVLMALGFVVLVILNRDVKVFQSSSPLFLIIILIGAIFMYIAFAFLFPGHPTAMNCILFQWFHYLGFALVYGSLALKTWRVSTTFRVRSAHKVEVTDMILLRHLAVILVIYIILLLVWTVTNSSHIKFANTVSDLIYVRCSTSWFDYTVLLGNILLLIFALWLCYRVRKAPSAYSENRFISWAIYNAMFVICFFAILRGLTEESTNPDIIYAVEFVFVHMISTVMLLLIFIPKCIIIRKVKRQGISATFTNTKGHHSSNGSHLYVSDTGAIERENEDLKAEVKRLSSKVAYLQGRMMRDRNKHIKASGTTTWKRDRSNTKDDDGEPVDLCKVSPSPVSRFLSSHV